MRLFLREWQVAFRLLPQGSILTDRETPFVCIPNTRRYTAADPFLFTEAGVTYLFAEIYDKKEGRGKLGYSVFDGNRFSPWKIVISEPYHLSYPNIFRWRDRIYLVPESNESHTLYAYKAVSFPDNWVKCDPILTERRLVDTTFLDYDGRHLMFTYDIGEADRKKLFLYSVNEQGKAEPFVADYLSDDDAIARPGGNLFFYQGDVIRVSQDCTGDYGVAVVFSKIIDCTTEHYAEEKVLRLSPADISVNKHFITGLHTYNANETMEVIDLHVADFDPMTQVRRILEKTGLRK